MGYHVEQTLQNGSMFSTGVLTADDALAFARRCVKDAERRSIDEVAIINDDNGGCVWYVCTSMFVYFVTLKGVLPFWCDRRSEVTSVLTECRDDLIEFSCEMRTQPHYGAQNAEFEVFVQWKVLEN